MGIKIKKLTISVLTGVLLLQLLGFTLLIKPEKAHGADDPLCGTTIIANLILDHDINCSGDGLVVGADGITIDGGNYTITGNGAGLANGISNPSGFDDITIQNLNITNFGIGIYFSNTTGSIINRVITNSNTSNGGIYLINSSSNTLTNNITNSNFIGIYLVSSSLNHLIGNTANSNSFGFWLSSSDSSILENNTTNLNSTEGIFLIGTSLCTLENNTVNFNRTGIWLSSSSSNTVRNNTINSNMTGILINNPSSNTITGNVISNNMNDISNADVDTNTYSSNQFLHNITSKMLTFIDSTRRRSVGDTVSFSISTFTLSGADCNNCATIATYPTETINKDSEIGNDITGHFTVTRPGTYSLSFTVVDTNLNTTKRKMLFFVGNTGSQITKYYLRGISPTHGQPNGQDAKALTIESPASSEEWNCAIWIQNSPDVIPNYPLAFLTDIDINSWYKQSAESGAYIGVQRYATYNYDIDLPSVSILPVIDYTSTGNKNFPNLNWTMDYFHSWYKLAVKQYGDVPYWISFPDPEHNNQLSYADFTYQYTTTPAIKSISNENIQVLSATAPSTDTNNAQIVLDGTGSTNIVLDSYHRPFIGYQTTINSDGIATLAANNLTGETTINSAKMDITPNAGTIVINIDTWNTSGNYSKKWTETGNGVSSAGHVVGDLKVNTLYNVYVDGILLNNYSSNQNGEISFTYDKGYSTKTFEIRPIESLPITGAGD